MRLINGDRLDLVLASPDLEKHFSDPYNYTKEILDQFETSYYAGTIPDNCRTMLDIGANIGLFALHVTPLSVLSKLVCVEPTPSHFDKLKRLTSSFHFIKHENAALAGHTGKETFYTCGINTTMNSLHKRDAGFLVDCITLEDLLNKHQLETVDFAKIDIEGGEDVAITEKTLAPVKDRIKNIFIELHPPNTESQDKWKAIFEAVGYKVEKMFHDSLKCTS
jgi:FkbM family methyltransferase